MSGSQCDKQEACAYDPDCPFYAENCRHDNDRDKLIARLEKALTEIQEIASERFTVTGKFANIAHLSSVALDGITDWRERQATAGE